MTLMIQVQQGKIQSKKTTRKTEEKNQKTFGIWITHILFEIIHINGLLNLFVKRMYSKVMLIIVVLHILQRHFHPKRSMSIMIASFPFTKEILKTVFMILFLLREQNGSREPGKLCLYLFCCKSLKIARNNVGIFYS